MILSRVIDHVKAQNWTAIFLDFVIVVMGVFIGIQIGNWNEDIQSAKKRTAAIGRLHHEAEQATSYFRRMVDFYENYNTARSEAIARIIDRDWEGADLEKMTRGIVSIGLLPAAAPSRSVYDEIISTGLFADIGDAALREAISKYYSQLSFLQGQIDYSRQLAADFPDWRRPEIRAVFAPGTERERRYIVDFDIIGDDPDFLEGMVAANNSLRALTRWWRDTEELARKMCDETARVSGEPCDPPKITWEQI